MCSKRGPSLCHTLTFRLTLLYLVLFCILLAGVFLFTHVTLRSILLKTIDARLVVKLSTYSYFGDLFVRQPDKAKEMIFDNFDWDARTEGVDRIVWCLLSAEGTPIVTSETKAWTGLPQWVKEIPYLPKGGGAAEGNDPGPVPQPGVTYTQANDARKTVIAMKTCASSGMEHPARTAAMRYENGMTAFVAYSLQDADRLLARFRRVFGVAFGAMLVSGAGLGFFISHRAMKGVHRVTRTAVGIGRGDLGLRVPVGHEGSEIEDLAVAFNEMLARIENLVKELKEVTTNIAHDLRSPIARIRGTAETALQRPETLESYREANSRIIAECDRLVGIIKTMLDMAAMDSGAMRMPQTAVDIHAVVAEACELFGPVAEDKGVALRLSHGNTALTVQGSREGLQRVVANLVDNAIKFTAAGGEVGVEVHSTQAQVSICVSDTGIGLSPENLQRIFDRFFRADSSRSSEGNGLGLSLARSIVRAHGGEIDVASELGKGSRFTVTLPRS
jgi:heavy metal sensor kinase